MMEKAYRFWFGGRPAPRMFMAFMACLLICALLKIALHGKEAQITVYMAEAIILLVFAIPTITLSWWKSK